jgi:hypothetical protein
VRDPLEVRCALLPVARVQRERDDGDVVDPLGLDNGRHHAQALGQPVLVGLQHVVQANHRLGARHADLELDGEHRHAGARHRVSVLDAGDLRQHLLGRQRDHRLDVVDRCARELDEHVGHGDVDLRLLLARGDEHREQAHQQRDQREQRRDLRVLEVARDAS